MRSKINQKKERNILLTEHIRNRLEGLVELEPQARAKLYFDQRKKSLDSIEYLIFMLKHLPEKQQERIFTTETMRPFFEALFKLKIEATSHEDYVKRKESEEKPEQIKQKRQRLLALSAEVLSLIGRGDFAHALLPEILKPYLTWGYPPIENFKAILSYSLQDGKDL